MFSCDVWAVEPPRLPTVTVQCPSTHPRPGCPPHVHGGGQPDPAQAPGSGWGADRILCLISSTEVSSRSKRLNLYGIFNSETPCVQLVGLSTTEIVGARVNLKVGTILEDNVVCIHIRCVNYENYVTCARYVAYGITFIYCLARYCGWGWEPILKIRTVVVSFSYRLERVRIQLIRRVRPGNVCAYELPARSSYQTRIPRHNIKTLSTQPVAPSGSVLSGWESCVM